MRFELKVALRFLTDGKGQTLFILLGIIVGVAVQVFLNTLIGGLQIDLINQTVGSSPHIWIEGKNQVIAEVDDSDSITETTTYYSDTDLIDNWEGIVAAIGNESQVTAVVPKVERNMRLELNGLFYPVLVSGIRIREGDLIYNYSSNLLEGTSNIQKDGWLIGEALSQDYKLKVGDRIQLANDQGNLVEGEIIGIYDLGNEAANRQVIMPLDRLQKIYELNQGIDKIEIQIKDVFEADTVKNSIQGRLNGVRVQDWLETNKSLLSALRSQSSSSYMIQGFVLLAITLGIASVLAVSVVQKSKQLGILKAMGTTAGQTRGIFLLQGAMLGTVGGILGAAVGVGLIQGFLFGTSISTGEPIFPLVIEPINILVIVIIAIVASTLAAYLPARQSAVLNPVEVIRNG